MTNSFRFIITIAFILISALSLLAQTTIAIAPFRYSGSDQNMRELARNIPDMLSTNLSQSGNIQIVERSRIEAVLSELHLQQSQLIDNTTAVKIGELVGASQIIVGAVTAFSNMARLDARLVEVETGNITSSAKVEGSTSNPFTLVDALSSKLQGSMSGGQQPSRNAVREIQKVLSINPPVNPPQYQAYINMDLMTNVDPDFTVWAQINYSIGDKVFPMHIDIYLRLPDQRQEALVNIGSDSFEGYSQEQKINLEPNSTYICRLEIAQMAIKEMGYSFSGNRMSSINHVKLKLTFTPIF